MFTSRSTSFYIAILGLCVCSAFSTIVLAEIAPSVKEKIFGLETLQSINTLLVTATTSATSTSKIKLFSAGKCAQASSKLDDSAYMLQVINDTSGLPKTYVPKKLVDVRPRIDTTDGALVCVTEQTALSLYDMMKAMTREGLYMSVVSGYRSYAEQAKTHKELAPKMNKSKTGSYDRVALPGYSEHQLGTAVDVASETKSGVDFGLTRESVWIKTNAHKYGFIVSYDQGAEDKTGYMYEPWHLRYVGIENATLLKEGNYSLAYKSTYYKQTWLNTLLARLKDSLKSTQIGG